MSVKCFNHPEAKMEFASNAHHTPPTGIGPGFKGHTSHTLSYMYCSVCNLAYHPDSEDSGRFLKFRMQEEKKHAEPLFPKFNIPQLPEELRRVLPKLKGAPKR